MTTLGTSMLIASAVFWAVWLLATSGAKKGRRQRPVRPAG
jgi:hypothetical protein